MYTENKIDLSSFMPEFKAIVLKHANSMNSDQFASYVNISKPIKQGSCSLLELISQAVGEVDAEMYESIQDREPLDEISGQAVYFLSEFGVYFWPSPEVPFCIDLWLTYPASPPGW